MRDDQFYVDERPRRPWYKRDEFDHVVRDRKHRNAIVAAGPDHCMELVAEALNTAMNPGRARA